MKTNTRLEQASQGAEAQATIVTQSAGIVREPCSVMLMPGVDFARAARMASLDMALTDDEYDATLSGAPVTSRVPVATGETWKDYADRAASAVMVAYLVGWA